MYRLRLALLFVVVVLVVYVAMGFDVTSLLFAQQEDTQNIREAGGDDIQLNLEPQGQESSPEGRDREQRRYHNHHGGQDRNRDDDRNWFEHRMTELDEALKRLRHHREELAESENVEAREEVERAISRIENEIRERAKHQSQQYPGRHREEHPEITEQARQIEHFHRLARNLEAAGQNDLAHELHKRVQHMERELQQGKERMMRESHRQRHDRLPMEEVHRVIQQMREEVQHLHHKVNELRELRQEVNELRELFKRSQ